MKKATVIFFLALFCVSQTAHFIFYHIQRWHIQNLVKEEILAGIPDKYLEIIEYSIDVKWEEEGKEFSLKGDFYDVVRVKKMNQHILLFCLKDTNEEELLKNFAKTIHSSTESQSGKNDKQSFKFPLMDQQSAVLINCDNVAEVHLHKYFNFKTSLPSPGLEIVSPPPRLTIC